MPSRISARGLAVAHRVVFFPKRARKLCRSAQTGKHSCTGERQNAAALP